MTTQYLNKARGEWVTVATYYDVDGETTGEDYGLIDLCASCRARLKSEGHATRFAEEGDGNKECAECGTVG